MSVSHGVLAAAETGARTGGEIIGKTWRRSWNKFWPSRQRSGPHSLL